jgi:pyruvate dehydrogenase E1 component alpha subunit
MTDRTGRGTKRLGLLRQMIRIRRFELRCTKCCSLGDEAIAAGVLQGVGLDDPVVSTYREHAHAVARGLPMRAILDGYDLGHFIDPSRQFYGGAALQVAADLSLSLSMRHRPLVTVCLLGDDMVSDVELHESLDFAAEWRLPILFCREIDVSLPEWSGSAVDPSAYGIPARPVDGMAVLDVADAVDQAVAAIRAGIGPQVLDLRTYRFRPRRSPSEMDRWREFDPIPLLTGTMRAEGELTDTDLVRLESDVDEEITTALAADLDRLVYATR